MSSGVGSGWKGTPFERFARKVAVVPTETGCLLWIGSLNSSGYGNFFSEGRIVQAHRWAWERAYGPIPEGLEIDHTCRTPACVSVLHLEPVTGEENRRRARHCNGNTYKTHCPQNHPYDEENTYVNQTTGRRYCKACRRIENRAYRARRRVAA